VRAPQGTTLGDRGAKHTACYALTIHMNCSNLCSDLGARVVREAAVMYGLRRHAGYIE